MRRKYNITQKNTKQISIKSLRVDLGVGLWQISFCTLLPILKYLIAKIYKYLSIQTLHTCEHHTQYLVKNFSHLFPA
jgi:hypothetical protein